MCSQSIILKVKIKFNSIDQGYCFITVPSEAKANEIIMSHPHLIKGNKLQCTKADILNKNYHSKPSHSMLLDKKQNKSKYKYSLVVSEKNNYKEPDYLTSDIFQCISLFIYHELNHGENEIPLLPNQLNSYYELNNSKTFSRFFSNNLTVPKTENKFKSFDVNGEQITKLSSYQNKPKKKLFKSETETESTSDKDSSESNSNKKEKTVTSSESEISLDVGYDDCNSESKEKEYYGPRTNRESSPRETFEPY